MLQRYLLLWLVLTSGVALAWPRVFGTGFDPFVASQPYLNVLLAVTMFLIGWLLPREELLQVGRGWPLVVFGTAVQYTSMPTLSVLACWVFGIEGDARIGVILAGCVPGAMASNVLTLLARGNVSYSVCLTTSATLLSPIVVPLGLRICLGRDVPLDPWNIFIQLCWMVVGPVLLGFGLAQRWPQYQATAGRWAQRGANLTILWIIAAVVAVNRDRLTVFEPWLYAALAFLNGFGYVAGWGAGYAIGMKSPTRRALTLEVGMQNAGLGTVLAINVLHNQAAAIPCALYTFGCMFTGTLLAWFWHHWPTGEPTAAADQVSVAVKSSPRGDAAVY